MTHDPIPPAPSNEKQMARRRLAEAEASSEIEMHRYRYYYVLDRIRPQTIPIFIESEGGNRDYQVERKTRLSKVHLGRGRGSVA